MEKTADQDKIWDYYQNRSGEIFDENTGRLKFILKNIATGEKVLDIGVGNGTFERLALEKGIQVYALDPSEESISKLQSSLHLGERAKAGRSEAMPFPDSFFDTVVMSEVLEHLPDEVLRATILEVARVLKTNGRFIGTVPSREDLDSSHVICPHCGSGFHRWGHQSSFTPESIPAILGKSFTARRVIERKFVNWRRRKGLGIIVALLKVTAPYLGIRVPDQSIYFEAVKRSSPL